MQKAVDLKRDAQQKSQQKQMEQLQAMASFDWKKVPPPMLAQMIVNIPFRGAP